MERSLRTCTPRTCREAFGQDLPPEAFAERRPSRATGAIALAIVLAALFLSEISRQREIRELFGKQCQPVGQTVNGDTVWACEDGMRVSPVAADAVPMRYGAGSGGAAAADGDPE
ncbi:MAG: hypothetical protein FGM40_06695 [Rhodocyclaceae bacterium]|nr:hypothetical protein [Rhodocyclaceae bacterium]